jgi:hypothetical protein
MTVPTGATTAGAAAAAARRRREEEDMTSYTKEDLTEGWEFKILRSATGAFKHPDKMKAALQDEARAGWVLVEKFDGGRIRLKRPARARDSDANLDFDPYRTRVGISEGGLGLLIVLAIFGAIAVGALVVALVAS